MSGAEPRLDPAGLPTPRWVPEDGGQFAIIARNLTTRYVALATEMVVGILLLPFNLQHLGPEAYGLWMLSASVTIHFGVLDMGYGGALVKFMAQYRAHRDARALNEIASTLFFVFAGVGLVAYAVAAGVAFNLDSLFTLAPGQAQTGRWIVLIIGLNVALNFPFSIYGGVINGFQRYDVNNVVDIVSATVIALANVAVLLAGYGLVPLVAATTSLRILTYFVFRRNAFRVYPALRISPSLFRKARLRELTGFSVYSAILGWANKLNYQLDAIVIGVFLGSAPVAIWAVAGRVVSATQRLSNQLNGVLFPVIVESDATNQTERLQRLLLEGTRLSLAMVMPIAVTLMLLAEPLVRAWVGERMLASAPLIVILAVAVMLRVGNATGTTLLKGAGRVRYLAGVNMATGVANLVLSALLVKPFGLIGVAVGTLVPIAISTVFVLFPAACRRVDLPIATSLRRAVWPAVWPAAVVGLMLSGTRHISSGTFLAVAVQSGMAAAVYFALFFLVAVGRRDRAQFAARLREMLGWKGHLVRAA